MAILKNVDSLHAIKQSHYISQMCSPLLPFNISYFNHIRIYRNRSRLSLGNRGDWLEHFYNEKYYSIGNFSRNPNSLTSGYYLWDAMNPDNVLSVARTAFNIDHGITIVDKQDLFVDLFLFATSRENYLINNFYINNIEILKHFVRYYLDKSQPILNKCKPDIVVYNEIETTDIPSDHSTQIIETFYETTRLKKYNIHTDSIHTHLSSREHECLKLLSQGYSAKEASFRMHISARTFYFYIENIKTKLHCHNKSQLLCLFRSQR